ncbi:MAG: hypothetical protein HY537_15725 [Deltaproteobacteria bacterium]|nr:hypothetical protein [Deltaproteobacteria bacterium]
MRQVDKRRGFLGWAYRGPTIDNAVLSDARQLVKRFLQKAPLNESCLIFDGPGIGLGTPLFVLSLLGKRRLDALKAIHFLSGSSFAPLWFYAKNEGQLLLTPENVANYYSQNQRDRGVKPVVTLLVSVGRKLRGAKWVHPNVFLEDCLRPTLSQSFLRRPIGEWPANVHFWTYDKVSKRFIDLTARGEYPRLPTSKLVCATAAIGGLFEPLYYEGAAFIDAILAPGIKEHLKQLRAQSTNNLICHMYRSGEKANNLFLKLHSDRFAYRRLGWDYFIWLAGLKNREVGETLRVGLFELKPQRHSPSKWY